MTDAATTRFWNVPNSLTMGRLALSFVVFALIAFGYFAAALVVFILASISDGLDGYFARKLGQATAIGRQLDPLVDKVINCGAYIYLLAVPDTGVAPWMVTTIVVRELVVQAVRSQIEGRGEAFGARMAGKLKTVFMCLSISAILIGLSTKVPRAFLYARDGLTWGAVLLTIYSGYGYVALAWPKLRGDSTPPS